ncbi:N,N-dimethylformamidase beta subunit family domain-containing protein [Noviherbaspirillum aridicola]|nr:N,N-dimethylformamidase beta subunit family domain-containing protein [Noviherbaspirillum aridicola]
MTRFTRRKFLCTVPLVLAGCGGGGGGGDKASGNGPAVTPPADKPADPLSPRDPAPADPPPEDPPPQDPPPPQKNVIQLENEKTEGVTRDWYIEDRDYARLGEIEGYASATSINRGESIRLYVNTPEPGYTMSVYRIGWYGGAGGRLVAGPITRAGVVQPLPSVDSVNRLVECDWTDPYVLSVPRNEEDPTDWASGIYLVRLRAGVSGKQSYIIFVVRDDEREAALLFQASVTTYAAYNNWGGYSFYDENSLGNRHAYKLSFNRPYRNPQRPCDGKGAGDFLSWEHKMLRFAEREGYDVAYTTNIAVHRKPEAVQRYRGFLSVGHDEYWTRNMRDALEQARDKGVHLAFVGANAGYWQIRLEPDARLQPDRTVVCYKYHSAAADPMYGSNLSLTTLTWRDLAINRPEVTLIGVMYDYNSVDLDMVMDDCSGWICAGTDLRRGSVLRGMLGYEVDRVDPLLTPAGTQILASSPYQAPIDDTAPVPVMEVRYSNMTYYTAASGAGVFATGSMQWNWGLDDFGPWGDRVNPAVQQIMRNVLRRFCGLDQEDSGDKMHARTSRHTRIAA